MNEGYKMTELGEIPESWEIVRLDKIVKEYILGGNYENSEDGQGLPLIKMGNINRGKISVTKIERVPEGLNFDEKFILKKGDLLFNTRNTLELVGKVAVWRNELKKALFNSNLMRISFDESKVSSNFFMNYVFNSEYGITQLKSFATGTTSVAAIYNRDLLKFRVLLPTLEEQQKIAEILSTVDEKIEVIEEQIKQTTELKKGLMQQLLTKGIGHTQFKDSPLGEIPESWEVVKLRTIGRLTGGNAFKANDFNNNEIGYQVVRMGNVQPHGLDLTKNPIFISQISKKEERFILQDGDLLITLTGTVGKTDYGNVAYIENYDSLVLNQRVGKFEYSNQIHGKFLFFIFNSTYFRTQFFERGKGGTGNQTNVGKDGFETILIFLPTKKEQIKISLILTAIDEKLEVLQDKKNNFQELKKGLMQQLLTGKLRVQTEAYV